MAQGQDLRTSKEMAEFFNLSQRRIEQLAQKGIIPKAARGIFDFIPTVKAYIRYLQGVVGGGIGTESADLQKRLLTAQVEEREAKARQAKYQADLLEGKLLKLDDVSQQWTARYIELKAAMLEFPRRVAFRFTDPAVRISVEEEANAFVIEALEKYSREGITSDNSMAFADTEEGAASASFVDGEPMG